MTTGADVAVAVRHSLDTLSCSHQLPYQSVNLPEVMDLIHTMRDEFAVAFLYI